MQRDFSTVRFARKVLIAIGVIIPILLLLWLLGSIIQLLLLVVAAVLIHCFFMSFAQWINHRTKLPIRWALGAAVLIVLGIIFWANWFLAPHIVTQIKQLASQIPQSFESAENYVQQFWWGRYLIQQIPPNMETFVENNTGLMQQAFGLFSTTFGVLANIYVVVLLVAYFLVNPLPYVKGVVALFPKNKRPRIQETIKKVYLTLQLWLEGKLLSMLAVGVLTIIGLYILGIPLALTLGLLAGLLSFIPNFGPILSAIPAILVAFTHRPIAALYVILLYIGVQALESNFITPLIQRHMIHLPFAMILIAQVVFGILTGFLGLILATPITAAIIVTVRMLYVHDVLGDEEATVIY